MKCLPVALFVSLFLSINSCPVASDATQSKDIHSVQLERGAPGGLTTPRLVGTGDAALQPVEYGNLDLRLTTDGAESTHPTIGAGSDGVIRVAWSDNRTGAHEIWWAAFTPLGQPVYGPFQLTTSGGSSASPRMDLDAQNRSFIVWQEGGGVGGQIFFARLASNGAVEIGPIQISSGGSCIDPDIATTPSGTSHVVFERTVVIHYMQYIALDENGVQICTVNPGDFDILGVRKYPSITVDPDGTPYMLWRDINNFTYGLYFAYYFSPCDEQFRGRIVENGDDISWSAPLVPAPLWVWFYYQDAISSTDRIYIWNGWNNPRDPVSPLPGPARRPRVAGTAGFETYLAWEDHASGTSQVVAQGWEVDTGAPTTGLLDMSDGLGAATLPDIDTDDQGEYYVVWRDDRDGNGEIYFDSVKRNGIDGYVVDALNQRGIGSATVEATPFGETVPVSTAYTTADGYYFLRLAPGSYEISTTHSGYESKSYGVSFVSSYTASPTRLSSRTVLLVHGIFADSDGWSQFESDLVDKAGSPDTYRIETVDMVPNHPWGWVSLTGNGVADQALRLEDKIDALRAQGIQSMDIVAHSMGGLVSRYFAKNRDGQVIRKLVMLGTPNHGSELANGAAQLAWLLPVAVTLAVDWYPARRDLVPGSHTLNELNYGGADLAPTNKDCVVHPDETLPQALTQYVTYAGTHGVSSSCSWKKRAIGSFLESKSKCSSNDGVVPSNSVPLMSNSGSGAVTNYQDIDTGIDCEGIHFAPLQTAGPCTPMRENDCVAAFVHDVLQGNPIAASGPSASPAAAAGDGGEHILGKTVAIEPLSSVVCSLNVGTCDSLELVSLHLAGETRLTLVDPLGNPVDSAAADLDPDIDYEMGGDYEYYIVRDPDDGLWQLSVESLEPVDSAFVGLAAIEYSDVTTEIAFGALEVGIGDAQVLTVSAQASAVPITAANVVGVLVAPDATETPFTALDDGMGDDAQADDGIYTASFPSNTQIGAHIVSVDMSGSYGGGQQLERSLEAAYFVDDRPDATVTSVELTPSSPAGEDSVRVDCSVSNLSSTAAAESVRVRFRELDTGLVFDEIMIGTLAPATGANVSSYWITREVPPGFSLGASVDVLSGSGESDASNNQAYASFDIPSGIVVDDEHPTRPPITKPGIVAFPNPFNPEVTIRYLVPVAGRVELHIYDVAGRLVDELLVDHRQSGEYETVWKAENRASGVYFVRLVTGLGVTTEKVLLLK